MVHNGISILGPVNVPSSVPYHASQMYSSNLVSFLTLMINKGELKINREDEIIRESLVTQGGDVVNARVSERLGLAPIRAGEGR